MNNRDMNTRDMDNRPTAAKEIERKAQLLVAVVFLLGLLLGGVGTYYWQAKAAGWGVDATRKPTHAEILKQLTHDLSLTDEQEKQVSAIMDDVHARMKALDEQHRPEYDGLRAEGRQRIRALLTPEQQPKYTEFTKKLDDQRAKAQKER
jgi:Spy/CpxP family protein refolding chaperone